MFRPSDDATIFPFLIPANLFAHTSLEQLAELVNSIYKDSAMVEDARSLAHELQDAIYKYGIVNHPDFGKIYAYEVNGYGSFNIMDDANIPSLLGLPYLGAISNRNPVYVNTRRVLLSENNPFFFKGKVAEGIGGPHIGIDMIWPLSIIMRGLTSSDQGEIRNCIQTLQKTHGGTGFMHESFHKDDPAKFTRKWFAWANTLFGEFIYTTWKKTPALVV
jgi:meiotically up-regulated gene 157 (Mug157) protein